MCKPLCNKSYRIWLFFSRFFHLFHLLCWLVVVCSTNTTNSLVHIRARSLSLLHTHIHTHARALENVCRFARNIHAHTACGRFKMLFKNNRTNPNRPPNRAISASPNIQKQNTLCSARTNKGKMSSSSCAVLCRSELIRTEPNQALRYTIEINKKK